MPRYIDLTLPIVPHWRYPVKIEPAKSIRNGDAANATHFDLITHWYTHIDAPLHQVEGGKSLNDFPLDYLIGKAVVLDVSSVAANEPVTKEMLMAAMGAETGHSIIIIKTCWQQKTSWSSYEYWDNSPYLTEEACLYLKSLNPHVVGFDFPQDYDIRRLRHVDEHELDLTSHRILLKNDILMIEYMTNLWNVTEKVVDFIGLPTALENADGAQIRVVAIE